MTHTILGSRRNVRCASSHPGTTPSSCVGIGRGLWQCNLATMPEVFSASYAEVLHEATQDRTSRTAFLNAPLLETTSKAIAPNTIFQGVALREQTRLVWPAARRV